MRQRIFLWLCVFLTPAIMSFEGTDNTVVCQINQPVVAVEQASWSSQVGDFLFDLLDTSGWPPRWQCGEWSSFHGWLYIISDLIIWFSYFMIPITLGYFVYRKKTEQLPFRSIILLFIVFILGCGLTHLVDAAIFWWPAYRLSALIRFLTATVSLATVFALVKITPKVIEFKSPSVLENLVDQRTKELRDLNLQLQREIHQRIQAEQKLTGLYQELAEKNKGLEEINRELIKREHDLIRSEQREKELNQGLEKQVQHRTAELQVANRELEAFTYSVSHDLRAPLRAIDGYAKILQEDFNPRLDDHGRHLIRVITKNAKFMGQLIDDLLEFSRTSRLSPNKTTFRTYEEVKRIVDEMMLNETGRSVNVEIGELHNSQGDHAMLRQIWTNLVSNALKYTRKTPDTHIVIGSEKKDGEVLYFIRDNGVGFEMDYVGKLFGVFQRLHRKEEFEGTGVGLALVKRILERHQGKIWAEGEVGKGATFYFTLPD